MLHIFLSFSGNLLQVERIAISVFVVAVVQSTLCICMYLFNACIILNLHCLEFSASQRFINFLLSSVIITLDQSCDWEGNERHRPKESNNGGNSDKISNMNVMSCGCQKSLVDSRLGFACHGQWEQ